MPYELFLALRYLRSRQKRRLVRVTALIAVVGIAVGVAALIVALALANGFRDEMRDKILRGTAHLTVMRNDGQPMSDYRELAARVSKLEGVASASGTTYDGALVVGPKGSAYAVLRGIEGPAGQSLMDQTLVAGSSTPLFETRPDNSNEKRPHVVLGAELAARAGLEQGDNAEIISASSTGTTASGNRRQVRVAGIFRSGLFEYDSTWVYLAMNAAKAFTGGDHAASVISVQLKNIDDVKETAERVRSELGRTYSTVDWQEANRPLFTALAVERRIGALIIALIILIAALNITTTLILLVTERRRDIAVLNTLGATSKSIMTIFVVEGAIVGIAGAIAGVTLGIATVLLANRYKLISLPADVYSISNVPLSLNLRDATLAALVAVGLSILATLYPARAAASMRPAEMLRDAL